MISLPDTFAILGNPLSRSLSARLFNRYFSENKIEAVYLPFEIRQEFLGHVLSAFRETVRGFNVTSPYKEHVFRECDRLDDAARSTRSVNLVSVNNGLLQGFNTDVHGFTLLMKKSGFSGSPERIVILGSGGASRSVSFSLHSLYPRAVIEVFGRGIGKPSEDSIPYGLFKETCDIMVSTIPFQHQLSLMEEFSRLLRIGRPELFVDLVYNPSVTPFIKFAWMEKIRSMNGLDMFIGQAAEAIRHWFGSAPDHEHLIDLLGGVPE